MARMHKGRRSARSTRQLIEGLESRTLFSVSVGANIESVSDATPTQMFVDAMKNARGFGTASAPWNVGSVPVDANGWPLTDAGACFITEATQYTSAQQLPNISGTYHFSATGFCNVSGVACPVTVTNQVYNAATNTTTADVTLAPGATQLYLAFTGTNGGVKNIKLIRPGYAANTAQIFTNSFLNSIANISTLRMMDYAQTNNNPVVNWGDRAQVTDAVQTTNKGAAWEYAIDLANETHKDLWINIPEGATDAYVKNLALLFKNDLDPSLHVYVEYSNEVWNSSFGQYGANYDAAQQEEGANPSVLNYDGSNNTYYFAWRRVAERTVQISQDFASEYGQGAINTTVRPVLASQVAWTYVLRNQLEFMNAIYGSPSQYIYAVAGAPYINIGDLSNSATLTTSQVIGGLESAIATNATVIQQYDALAKNYGVKMDFYEAGVDLEGDTGGNFANAKLPANYAPAIAQVISDYLTNAYASNADLVMYYSLSSAWTPWGTWGLTENPADLSGPKYAAFNAFAEGSAPAVDVGTKLAVGGSTAIAGGSYIADIFDSVGSGGDAQAWNAQTYDYLVNATGTGQYTLNLSAGATNSSTTVTVLVDGVAEGVWTLANTGSQTAYATTGTISLGTGLAAGLHDIRLEISEGGFGIHALNIAGSASTTTPTTPTTPVTPTAPTAPASPTTPTSPTATKTLTTPKAPTSPASSTTPSGLKVTVLSTSQLRLTWSNVSGERGYAIERSPNGNNNWKQVGTTSVNVTAFTSGGLAAGTKYYYRVRAVLGKGKYSAYSNVALGTTARTVTHAATGKTSELVWKSAVGARQYVIQQKTAKGSWAMVKTVGSMTTSYRFATTVAAASVRVLAVTLVGTRLVSSSLVKV